MNVKKKKIVLLTVIICMAVSGLGWLAYIRPYGCWTFDAVITDIHDNRVYVKGMEKNGINFRGEFVFSIEQDTRIVRQFHRISFRELKIGDRIAVSFRGGTLEIYPVIIEEVKQIRLLN